MALHQQVAALAFEVTGLTAQISSLQADLGDQAQRHCVDLMHAREIPSQTAEVTRLLLVVGVPIRLSVL